MMTMEPPADSIFCRAVPQHLDARVLLDETLRGERVGRDLPLCGVFRETSDVHGDEGLPKAVLEAAELGDAHVQRRLAALEPTRKTRTGARELALRPATRRLALTLRRAPTETTRKLPRAARPGDLMFPHQPLPFFSSVTTMRWATRRIIPRSAGESSCDTTWPGRRSPSADSVCFAPFFSPIALLCWRISRRVTTPPRPSRDAREAREAEGLASGEWSRRNGAGIAP